MKKFIMFVIAVLVLAVAASFTMHAQYISDSVEQSPAIQQQKVNFYDLPQYQEAREDVRNGKTLFFTGLGCAVVGGTIVGLSPMLIRHDINYGQHGEISEYWNDGGSSVALIGGSVIAATGVVLNIIGTCKWARGAGMIRDLRFAYMLSGGGLVISF